MVVCRLLRRSLLNSGTDPACCPGGDLESPDAFSQAVLRRMVRGVSTREYEHVVDMTRDGFGVAKSCVSRGFVRASAADVKTLAERRFDRERFAVVMIDGVEYA